MILKPSLYFKSNTQQHKRHTNRIVFLEHYCYKLGSKGWISNCFWKISNLQNSSHGSFIIIWYQLKSIKFQFWLYHLIYHTSLVDMWWIKQDYTMNTYTGQFLDFKSNSADWKITLRRKICCNIHNCLCLNKEIFTIASIISVLDKKRYWTVFGF